MVATSIDLVDLSCDRKASNDLVTLGLDEAALKLRLNAGFIMGRDYVGHSEACWCCALIQGDNWICDDRKNVQGGLGS